MQLTLEHDNNLVIFIAEQKEEKINAMMIIGDDCLPLSEEKTEIENKRVFIKEFENLSSFLFHVAEFAKTTNSIISNVNALYIPHEKDENKQRHLKLVKDDHE